MKATTNHALGNSPKVQTKADETETMKNIHKSKKQKCTHKQISIIDKLYLNLGEKKDSNECNK